MGCISSKFLAASDLDRKISAHHVVSLTSTTYGALNLDHKQEEEKTPPPPKEEVEKKIYTTKVTKISPSPLPSSLLFTPQSKKRVATEEPSEIINTWELMKDLSDEIPIWSPAMRPAKSQATDSPKKQRRRLLSKENNSPRDFSPRETPNPNRVLRPFSSSANRQPSKLVIDVKSPKVLEKDWGNVGSRRSLSPLFDPELVASFEKELKKEGEQVKKIVSKKPNSSLLLEKFEEKCPPSGENALIFYSTTLRGIRKTFEDCNVVRNLIEGYDVKIIERDISMDSGFREELRVLMGKKEVRPPLLFVKGRLIGGAEEVLKLEEEGNLGILLEGIEKKEVSGCGFCGGVRFVMCRECNGSCKVLDEEEKKMVKCEECNENGLIHCPLCC